MLLWLRLGGVECFDRECGGVMFSRGQAADRIQQICTRQLFRFFSRLSTNQLSQNRSTNKCRRTAVSEISRCLDAIVFDDQREPQPIAANGILLVCDGVGVRKFTGVTWMRKMIFELSGVGQDLSSG